MSTNLPALTEEELRALTPQLLYETAARFGLAAAEAANAKLPDERGRGFDCGFAWVVVKPARGPFITWAKRNGKGHSHYHGGWCFWYSEFSTSTQSVGVHEEGAKAFCGILRAAGLEAYVGSRLD